MSVPRLQAFMNIWIALWSKAVPRVRVGPTKASLRGTSNSASMRAMLAWAPDWKTQAIGRILASRAGLLVDVGANVGQTLLDYLCAPKRQGYIGIEPNPACIHHLSQFVAANRLSDCRIVPAAIGDKDGITRFFTYGGEVDSGATTVAGLRPRLAHCISDVALFRLDSIADDLGLARIALIKIDVEGAELAVLQGMKTTVSHHRPWVLCEVLRRDRSADPDTHAKRCASLAGLLEELEMSAFRIIPTFTRTAVQALERVTAFPSEVWDDEISPATCDYLFVPRVDESKAIRMFGA